MGDIGAVTSENSQFKYWQGITPLIAIPLILAVLSSLFCPIWTLCRCCKCCCCKKKRPKEKVTKCNIYIPYFVVLGSVIAIVAMAAIAYGANVDFSGALLYNKGEAAEGNLFDVAEEFMSEGVNKVFTIRNITLDIKSGVVTVVDEVQDILNDTSILSVGTSVLFSMLNSISILWNNYNITTDYNGETYQFQCEFCTTFSSSIGDITTQVDSQVGPIFSDLNKTVNAIGSQLVDVEETILEQIDGFVTQIDDVGTDLSDAEDELKQFRPNAEKFNKQRESAYNVIFAIPLLPIIFILFGGILKKPICFSFAYICLWFSCTLMWLLLALHLPIAVLLNDACNLLDVIESDVKGTVNNTAGEIFEACLTNEKLVDTLGLGSSLNFSNSIEFPSFGNLTEQFSFSDLLSFEDDAFSMNFTTFYHSGDVALAGINNLTLNMFAAKQHSFDRANVSTLNATEYYTLNSTAWITLEQLKDVLVAESLSMNAFNDTVYKIRSNVSSVTNQVVVIEENVEELVNNVDNASFLLNPLFDSVDDMIDVARCGFIGDAYKDTKGVMCSAVLGSLSRIVVAMFVIAVLSLFSCCWSVKLVRKVEWFQVQKKEDKDNKLKQSFQPNKPTIVVMQPHLSQPGGNVANGMYFNQAAI